jgi:hypothetical protein
MPLAQSRYAIFMGSLAFDACWQFRWRELLSNHLRLAAFYAVTSPRCQGLRSRLAVWQ